LLSTESLSFEVGQKLRHWALETRLWEKTGTGDPNDLESSKSPREDRKWAWF